MLALAPLSLLLSGCVAAAIPALATAVVAKDRIAGDGKPDPKDHPERIPIDYKAPPGTPMPGIKPTPVAEAKPQAGPVQMASAEPPPPMVASPLSQSVPVAVAAVQPLPAPSAKEVGPAAAELQPVKIAANFPPPEPVIPPAATAQPESAAVVAPAPVSPPAASSAPVPALAAGMAGPFAAFAGYALTQAPPPPPGTARRSALVDQDTITGKPELSDCGNDPPAVLLDLDPGSANFDPANPPLPAPGLADMLAKMRAGGLTVLWTANVPVERAKDVWTVLQATGLDPDRTDRLVLPRKTSERKQTRRLAAGRDWCIVAIAGDRKGDFDELFDYLRDPDGPIAQALAPELDHGWFIVPTPIE